MLKSLCAGLIMACLLVASVRAAEKAYGPGVTDTEIKIGQTMPYSGPASAFGVNGRVVAAYYKMINDRGGINGRKINFISLDDGYSPPRAVEQARRLVEQDGVLGLFGTLGAPSNAAMQRYLNDHKVPHFFVFSGATRMRDPHASPWTIGGDLAFASAAKAYAQFILANIPAPRIAVLYQNDDLGKDHLSGLRAGLGANAAALVKTASYETADPTVDQQMVTLKDAGANVLVIAATPKFAAQAIRKAYDIGWRPRAFLSYPASSIPGTLQPAGVQAATGIITADYIKQPGDPAWANDAEMLAFLAFMKTYAAGIDPNDTLSVAGYYHAAWVVELLTRCGDNLTRENLRQEATHLHNLHVPMLLPGIEINTSPDDHAPIKQMQLLQFDGTRWVKLGGIVGG